MPPRCQPIEHGRQPKGPPHVRQPRCNRLQPVLVSVEMARSVNNVKPRFICVILYAHPSNKQFARSLFPWLFSYRISANVRIEKSGIFPTKPPSMHAIDIPTYQLGRLRIDSLSKAILGHIRLSAWEYSEKGRQPTLLGSRRHRLSLRRPAREAFRFFQSRFCIGKTGFDRSILSSFGAIFFYNGSSSGDG